MKGRAIICAAALVFGPATWAQEGAWQDDYEEASGCTDAGVSASDDRQTIECLRSVISGQSRLIEQLRQENAGVRPPADVIAVLYKYFPEIADIHIDVNYHRYKDENENRLFVDGMTFYVPERLLEGALSKEVIRGRGLDMFAALGNDDECLNVDFKYVHRFHGYSAPLREVQLYFACG